MCLGVLFIYCLPSRVCAQVALQKSGLPSHRLQPKRCLAAQIAASKKDPQHIWGVLFYNTYEATTHSVSAHPV
jgi:hypothetical protein